MRQHEKSWPALIVPSTTLIVPTPAHIVPRLWIAAIASLPVNRFAFDNLWSICLGVNIFNPCLCFSFFGNIPLLIALRVNYGPSERALTLSKVFCFLSLPSFIFGLNLAILSNTLREEILVARNFSGKKIWRIPKN